MPGIYIHIPFCKQACHYCNFHFSTSRVQKDKMIEAIIKEISLKTAIPSLTDNNINTLYFGGGTPSILTPYDLKLIFDALHKRWVFVTDMEITLEANPDDITDTRLAEWLSLGINRLSLGVQSFSDEELKWMNRVHTAAESIQSINKIKTSGLSNLSVDLIYGSPVLTDENWKENVETVIEKNVPHISCYALTVEPKTALDKMIASHKKEPVDPEKQARQFLLLMEWMEQAGYEHYEISNFAKPGSRSRHNSSYWLHTPEGINESYYGFGPSAHSFDGKSRKWNVANNALYIQSLQQGIIPFEEEKLTEVQQLNEYIMTSLRTMEGLNMEHVSEQFGKEKSNRIEARSRKYENTGKIKIESNRIILTKEGKLFADGIAADLFF